MLPFHQRLPLPHLILSDHVPSNDTLLGAGHLSGPGSDHSLRQSGRILLALLDVLRCGLRTQALVTTLTTLQHTAMNNHVTLGPLTCIYVYRHPPFCQRLTQSFIVIIHIQYSLP